MSPTVSPEIRAKFGTGGGILTPKFPFGEGQFGVELTPAYYPANCQGTLKNLILR